MSTQQLLQPILLTECLKLDCATKSRAWSPFWAKSQLPTKLRALPVLRASVKWISLYRSLEVHQVDVAHHFNETIPRDFEWHWFSTAHCRHGQLVRLWALAVILVQLAHHAVRARGCAVNRRKPQRAHTQKQKHCFFQYVPAILVFLLFASHCFFSWL